eukprot:scaffold10820_cov132-Isochrysis_galbana.AAC.3
MNKPRTDELGTGIVVCTSCGRMRTGAPIAPFAPVPRRTLRPMRCGNMVPAMGHPATGSHSLPLIWVSFPPLGGLRSARGIALFRSAPSSTKLNFSLERTPWLAWGGNRTGSLSPRRALANRAGTWPKHDKEWSKRT